MDAPATADAAFLERLDSARGEPAPFDAALALTLAHFRADSGTIHRLSGSVLRLLAHSAAYRQSSQAGPGHREIDPANIWLARQARFRLDAELVRDNALAISGLLVPRVGGPSVKPYQPEGYWSWLNFPVRDWVHDNGENQYRRGMYTWWQRTFLHPSLLGFDARGYRDRLDQAPACLNILDFKDAVRARLMLFNDVSHYADHPHKPNKHLSRWWDPNAAQK